MSKIAIVMGGYSCEKEISISSGNTVYESLKEGKYHGYKVFIFQNEWFVSIENQKYIINKGDFSFEYEGKKVSFDLVFMAIHGTPGEDGKLQAYFDLLNIPYTSCDFFTSAITFTKKECLAVLKPYGFHMAKSMYISKNEKYYESKIIENLGLPFIVKPNRAGSSFGVSKVVCKEDFKKALDLGFSKDKHLLLEEFIEGREVSVGVGYIQNKLRAFDITEIIPHTEFFDYEAKYNGLSEEITPANFSKELTQKIQQEAVRLYQCLNLGGFVRVDFIIKNETPYFLEVNTIPGLSKQSLIPQQLQSMGVALTDFFEEVVAKSLQR